MSVESSPPPSEEPSADPSPLMPEEGMGDQDWLPKAKRRHRKNEAGPDGNEASEREILVLCSLLLSNLLDKRPGLADPAAIEPRSKANRFPAKTGIPAPQGVAVPDAPAPVAPVMAASPQMKLRPRTAEGAARQGHWQPTSSRWEKAMLYLLGALVAVGFMYFVGRKVLRSGAMARAATSSQPAGPVAKAATVWTPALISQLDAILIADQSGDLKTARQLAIDLKKQIPDTPDLDLYISTLQVRHGEFAKTEESILRMLNGFTPPLLAAAIHEHAGFIYARKRDLPLAITAFADAAAADPFSAVHFYHWGEALRRKGQLQEAIDRFGEAMMRLSTGTPGLESQRSEVEFKTNLTKIELGRDEDDLKSTITEHLKNPNPSGYWLLTAAAYAMQHGDMAAAADALRRARTTLPSDIYATLTNDYFLHGFAERDEVSAYLNVGSPVSRAQLFQSRMGYFVDP